MEDCWKLLGINPTNDPDKIKAAFRILIKKSHPDTVQSPEKQRKYTLKAAKLIDAYHEALTRATSIPNIVQRESQQDPGSNHIDRSSGVWTLLISWVGGALALAAVAGIIWLLLQAGIAVPRWFSSLPLDSMLREILSAVMVVPLAILFSWFPALFCVMPASIMWSILERSRFERYSWKIVWVLMLVGNIIAVYFFGFHFPFEHKATPYYAVLYEVCRFLICTWIPGYFAVSWILEFIRFGRVPQETIVAINNASPVSTMR